MNITNYINNAALDVTLEIFKQTAKWLVSNHVWMRIGFPIVRQIKDNVQEFAEDQITLKGNLGEYIEQN